MQYSRDGWINIRGQVTNISEPHGVAAGESGEIFVCDRYNFRVQQSNSSGIHVWSWRTTGIFDDSKHFPLGIAAGYDGAVYVVDHYAHCIQKYRP